MSKTWLASLMAFALLATGCAQPPTPPSYQPPATPAAQQIKIEGEASGMSPDYQLAAIAQIHAIDGATIDTPAPPGEPVYMTPGLHHLDIQVSMGSGFLNNADIAYDFKPGAAYTLQISTPVKQRFNCAQTEIWLEDWQRHDLTAKIPVLLEGTTQGPGIGPGMALIGSAMYHAFGQDCPGTPIVPQHYQWQG